MLRLDLIKEQLKSSIQQNKVAENIEYLNKSLYYQAEVTTKATSTNQSSQGSIAAGELLGTKVVFPSDDAAKDGGYLIYLTPSFVRGNSVYRLYKGSEQRKNVVKVKEASLQLYSYRVDPTSTTDDVEQTSPIVSEDDETIESAVKVNKGKKISQRREEESPEDYQDRFMKEYHALVQEINGALKEIDPEMVRKQQVARMKEEELKEKQREVLQFETQVKSAIDEYSVCVENQSAETKSILNFRTLIKAVYETQNCSSVLLNSLADLVEKQSADTKVTGVFTRLITLARQGRLKIKQGITLKSLNEDLEILLNPTTKLFDIEIGEPSLRENLAICYLLDVFEYTGEDDTVISEFSAIYDVLAPQSQQQSQATKLLEQIVFSVNEGKFSYDQIGSLIEFDISASDEETRKTEKAFRVYQLSRVLSALLKHKNIEAMKKYYAGTKLENSLSDEVAELVAPAIGAINATNPSSASIPYFPVTPNTAKTEEEKIEAIFLLKGIREIPGFEDFTLDELFMDLAVFNSDNPRIRAVLRKISDNFIEQLKKRGLKLDSTQENNLRKYIIQHLTPHRNELFSLGSINTSKGEWFEKLIEVEAMHKALLTSESSFELDPNSFRFNGRKGAEAIIHFFECSAKERQKSVLKPIEDIFETGTLTFKTKLDTDKPDPYLQELQTRLNAAQRGRTDLSPIEQENLLKQTMATLGSEIAKKIKKIKKKPVKSYTDEDKKYIALAESLKNNKGAHFALFYDELEDIDLSKYIIPSEKTETYKKRSVVAVEDEVTDKPENPPIGTGVGAPANALISTGEEVGKPANALISTGEEVGKPASEPGKNLPIVAKREIKRSKSLGTSDKKFENFIKAIENPDNYEIIETQERDPKNPGQFVTVPVGIKLIQAVKSTGGKYGETTGEVFIGLPPSTDAIEEAERLKFIEELIKKKQNSETKSIFQNLILKSLSKNSPAQKDANCPEVSYNTEDNSNSVLMAEYKAKGQTAGIMVFSISKLIEKGKNGGYGDVAFVRIENVSYSSNPESKSKFSIINPEKAPRLNFDVFEGKLVKDTSIGVNLKSTTRFIAASQIIKRSILGNNIPTGKLPEMTISTLKVQGATNEFFAIPAKPTLDTEDLGTMRTRTQLIRNAVNRRNVEAVALDFLFLKEAMKTMPESLLYIQDYGDEEKFTGESIAAYIAPVARSLKSFSRFERIVAAVDPYLTVQLPVATNKLNQRQKKEIVDKFVELVSTNENLPLAERVNNITDSIVKHLKSMGLSLDPDKEFSLRGETKSISLRERITQFLSIQLVGNRGTVDSIKSTIEGGISFFKHKLMRSRPIDSTKLGSLMDLSKTKISKNSKIFTMFGIELDKEPANEEIKEKQKAIYTFLSRAGYLIEECPKEIKEELIKKLEKIRSDRSTSNSTYVLTIEDLQEAHSQMIEVINSYNERQKKLMEKARDDHASKFFSIRENVDKQQPTAEQEFLIEQGQSIITTLFHIFSVAETQEAVQSV